MFPDEKERTVSFQLRPFLAIVHALFDAIINDDPLPEEKNADNTPVPGTPDSTVSATPDSANQAPSPPSEPQNAELVDAVTTNPQDITVRVSNSTGENGLALKSPATTVRR